MQKIYNSYKKIKSILDLEKPSRLFVVCGNYIQDTFVFQYLKNLNIEITVFDKFQPNPLYEEVVEGVNLFNSNNCDFILAIGGGSAIDVAKTIKLFSSLDSTKCYLDQPYVENNIPFLAMPTTAGTGSESTKYAVIYYNGVKQSITSENIIPKYVILEASFLETLPLYQKKATALDALCQAIESYWSVNSTVKSKQYSRKAIRLILNNIDNYIKNNESLNEMMLASNYSGRAINITQTTAAHAMSYKITSLYGISHGHAVAICLPHVWKYIIKHVDDCCDPRGINYLNKSLQELNDLFGCEETEQGVKKFNVIYKKLHLETPEVHSLNNIDELTEAVNILRLSNTPVTMDKDCIYKMYKKILFKKKKLVKKKISISKRIKRRIKSFTKQNSILNLIFSKFIYLKRLCKYKCYKIKYDVDDKTIMFESFQGKEFSCNPKAIYLSMLNNDKFSDYKFIWVFSKVKKFKEIANNNNTIIVRKYSKKYYKYCSKSKFWIANLSFPKWIGPKKEQIYIHTWHGKPMKNIGCNLVLDNDKRKNLKSIYKDFKKVGKKLTYLFGVSPYFTKIMGSAFDIKDNSKLIKVGYPRNSSLYTYSTEDVIRIKQNLNIPLDKKVLLYVPTWRNYTYDADSKKYVFHNMIDFEEFRNKLGEDYVLLIREHNLERNTTNDFDTHNGYIYDVNFVEDINDLYIITDLLISDYSGAIFDYANLKRPMLFYMYDYEKYCNEAQGIHINIDELPGTIVFNKEDLMEQIKKTIKNFSYDSKYKKFNKKYNTWDGPLCGYNFAKKYILGNENLYHSFSYERNIKPATKMISAPIKKFFTITNRRIKGFCRSHIMPISSNSKQLKAYKNSKLGETCILIGNGPSLQISDLEKINGIDTFACNLIYKIYDKTEWRPTFLCCVDPVYTKTLGYEFKKHITCQMFTNLTAFKKFSKKPKKILYVTNVNYKKYHVSKNILSYYVPAQATVMTFMIELAMYMGYKEIYLLGVDCTNSFVKGGHFIKDYSNKNLTVAEEKRAKRIMKNGTNSLEELGEIRRDRSMLAYEKLREYADKKGIKIYNSTRGGALEIFERYNFDKLVDIEGENK